MIVIRNERLGSWKCGKGRAFTHFPTNLFILLNINSYKYTPLGMRPEGWGRLRVIVGSLFSRFTSPVTKEHRKKKEKIFLT